MELGLKNWYSMPSFFKAFAIALTVASWKNEKTGVSPWTLLKFNLETLCYQPGTN